jgi:uncharacterized protein (TIGR02687 family)
MNLIEKIRLQFDKNPSLRVLFFFDKEEEYWGELNNDDLGGLYLINAEKSHFRLKIKLEHELFDNKVVCYFPYEKPRTQKELKKFILLDILKANKELSLDEVADFIDEFKLSDSHRKIVRTYIKELKLKKNQRVLAKVLNQYDFNEANLLKGLISCFLEFKTIKDPTLCLAKLFTLLLPENEDKYNQFEKKLEIAELNELIAKWLYDFLEVSTQTITRDILTTAINKLKYNVLVQHLAEINEDDQYKSLHIQEGFTLQRINSLIVDWENEPNLNDEMNTVFSLVGNDIQESKIIKVYGVDSGFTFYTDNLKFILMGEALRTVNRFPDKVQKLLQSISSSVNQKDELSLLIKFISSSANYYNKINSFSSFILDTPSEYIDRYVKDFSKLDTYYRHTVDTWTKMQKLVYPENINTSTLMDKIHSSYDDYLIQLNREWLDCVQQNGSSFNEIPGPKQFNFYKDQLADSDQKVVVIISDALRYECGEELLKEMLVDTKGFANISYMMTSLPSITQWGMANLLSDKTLSFDGEKLTINDIHVNSTENRQKVLQLEKETAVAVQYKKINTVDREIAREQYFNKKKLVYIYHNVIDDIGDSKKSELKTFSAVNEAIEDLKNLVTKVHASFAVGRVLITSDHGFLFNYNTLPEASFQKAPKGTHAKSHNRYIITKDISNVENCYEFKLSDCSNINSDYKLLTPKAINRFRRQGSGAHFVHGGASLQEMVIPLIESTRKRKDIGRKVPFRILNTDLKIVSGAIKVKIYQEESVSSTLKVREIIVGIYNDANELASSEISHTLDSPSGIATDRMKEFILNIDSKSVQESVLTLKVFEKGDKDKLNPIVNQKVINNTFMEMDF